MSELRPARLWRYCRWWLAGGAVAVLVGIGAAAALWYWRFYRAPSGALLPPVAPQPPLVADAFEYPLDPTNFGPYVPYMSGPLAVDTRFAAQNPGVGDAGKCFAAFDGTRVPFNRLYHAGEDWFALDDAGRVDGRSGAGAPVRAVANGVVTWAQSLGSDGYVLILEHHLPDGASVWSVYWHVADVQVAVGQAVTAGQPLAVIHDRGFNSHLHWEIRAFGDGSALFSPDSAGGRGACNGYVAGVGYTWDDVPERAQPEFWGYFNPTEFVLQH